MFWGNLEMQYHILFDHGGSDPYLFQEANVTLESDLSTKEDIAAAMEKTLSVYVGRVVGSMINNHTHVLKVLPWELLLEEDSDLENTIINKSDKIMKLEASIYTVVKFVYVYDKENDAWKFALSTNRVDYAYSLIIPVHKNSYTEQVVKTVNGLVANGKMGTSVEDASAAYKQNKSKNTCMNIFTIDYKDEMGDDDNGIEAGEIYKTSIYSPSLIVDMFYKK